MFEFYWLICVPYIIVTNCLLESTKSKCLSFYNSMCDVYLYGYTLVSMRCHIRLASDFFVSDVRRHHFGAVQYFVNSIGGVKGNNCASRLFSLSHFL